MERIGILGGTFNPIHNGHINMARCFLKWLNLDRILLVPVWSPPHKRSNVLLPAQERLNMCRLACKDDRCIAVSSIEIERGGVSYTFETLRELSKRMPDAKFYLITGSDMFLTLEQWKNFEEISKLAALCACSRIEGQLAQLREYAKQLQKKYGAECHIENIPVKEVSSTQVRAALFQEKDVSGLVPPAVLEYIREKNFYRT